MPQGLDHRTKAWVLESLGSSGASVASVTALTGGLSGAMFRIEVSGAAVPAVVLRRWSEDHDWHRESIRREAAALALLAGTPTGAPELVACDPIGDATGRPANLMTVVPGAGDLSPYDPGSWVGQLAERLVLIHDQPAVAELLPCGRFADLDDPERQTWMAQLPAGRDALDLARTADPPAQVSTGSTAGLVLSHGDYQHFNVLWNDGTLTGVVDWPMAGLDDRGTDVGHCMLNLAVLYTPERALDFLEQYEALADVPVPMASVVRELLDYSPDWQRFIPIQVDGRTEVDAAGMTERVGEVITALVGRAGRGR